MENKVVIKGAVPRCDPSWAKVAMMKVEWQSDFFCVVPGGDPQWDMMANRMERSGSDYLELFQVGSQDGH